MLCICFYLVYFVSVAVGQKLYYVVYMSCGTEKNVFKYVSLMFCLLFFTFNHIQCICNKNVLKLYSRTAKMLNGIYVEKTFKRKKNVVECLIKRDTFSTGDRRELKLRYTYQNYPFWCPTFCIIISLHDERSWTWKKTYSAFVTKYRSTASQRNGWASFVGCLLAKLEKMTRNVWLSLTHPVSFPEIRCVYQNTNASSRSTNLFFIDVALPSVQNPPLNMLKSGSAKKNTTLLMDTVQFEYTLPLKWTYKFHKLFNSR